MKIKRIIGAVIGFCLSFLFSGVALAAEFVPIVPIPSLDLNNQTTLAQYINALFKLAISIGAILAVISIIIGGFEYMTAEAVGAKKGGKDRVWSAVLGLVLLLLSWLILYVINPNILSLDALKQLGTQP